MDGNNSNTDRTYAVQFWMNKNINGGKLSKIHASFCRHTARKVPTLPWLWLKMMKMKLPVVSPAVDM